MISLIIQLGFSSCTVQRELLVGDDSVEITKMLNINGVGQAVVIRGKDLNNPVLIHVHGGPGYPLFPYIDNFSKLEEHFTIVYWEQRGTGKSLHKGVKDDGMHTDTLLSDLNVVVDFARTNLGKDKVLIWGHSWGSNLGVMYAHQFPKKLYAYVGTGQSVDLLTNERMCLAFAMEKAQENINSKALKQLHKIDTTNYQLKDALEVRKWVYTYGGIVHDVNTEKAYINFDVVRDVFATPEYNMSTKWRILFRSKYSGKNLWTDMMDINLFVQVKALEVPVYFFLGEYDHIVSSRLAAEYFESLDVKPSKELVWFKESAHRPHSEEPEKFLKQMLRVKKSLKE